MGSGLIWAGIGKGISDAGDNFTKYMMADIADRRQAAREDAYATRQEKNLEAAAERQSARDSALFDRQAAAAKAAQEKAEALENLRAENAIKKTEKDITDRRTRAKEDLVEIGTRADKAEAARVEGEDLQITGAVEKIRANNAKSPPQFNKKGTTIPQSREASEDEIRKLIKDNPQAYDLYEQAGLINKSKMIGAEDRTEQGRALRRLDDESKAALEIGADKDIIQYYKDKREFVLKQIKTENERERYEARIPIEQQKADAATTSANRPRTGRGGSNSSSPKVRLEAQAETIRKAIKDERDPTRRAQLKTDLDNVLKQMREARGDANPAAAPKPGDKNPGKKDYSNLWK